MISAPLCRICANKPAGCPCSVRGELVDLRLAHLLEHNELGPVLLPLLELML